MKTAIATVSISGDLPEKLSAIAAAGFDGIEIFENDFIAFDRSPREVGEMVRDHGLDISLFQPFRDFEGMPEPERARTFDRIERKFDLMQELGTDLMLICSNVSQKALGGIDRAAADFNELGQRAAKRNLRVGYEALAWGRFVNDHRDAWETVRRADHPNVGLILDSFHTLARGIDPASIRSIPGDRIFFVQLADAPRIDMDLLFWSRHFRNMPGQGDLDVPGFMEAVSATGYQGVISLEIFNDQFRGASPKSIAKDGVRALSCLMDEVRRRAPEAGHAAPDMPARVKVKGVSFMEFSAPPDETDPLVEAISALGFAPAGRHVNKAVEVWRQGDIRIVINNEQEGFAHSHHLMHGLGVCDTGLLVADAEATRARAAALAADTFAQAVGPGELEIPAVRGVGGSLLHFIDETPGMADVWDIEFAPLGSATSTECGLTRVDHIAQTMAYEEMLTWVLFYTSVFDTTKTPMLDVVDPAGLVRSQAIESPDGALRITLNGAENRDTFAGRFISSSFGPAVQHIAFATNDIFETAHALDKRGFEVLEISPNYYDDLGARFGLDDGLLDRLRALNLLYDRDETGEFFQRYSKAQPNGFFFEIVERRAGYGGYGATNAPFRIAAQKRTVRPKGIPQM